MDLFTASETNISTCDLYEHKDTARILLSVFYGSILILGLLGNTIALTVIFKNRKKINSTTLYSTNLVFSDLLFCIALPTRIAYYGMGFHWPFGEALCRITALLFYINTYAGVNFMTCLSIDRFFAVVHPFRYKIRRIKYAKGICVFVWFLEICTIEDVQIPCCTYICLDVTNSSRAKSQLGLSTNIAYNSTNYNQNT
ncbi:hypothetical protein EK904_003754 [Melospiza melodia maxima]|nr:hypothetical protein EK904_003754 [Melospiza melodia maxima]